MSFVWSGQCGMKGKNWSSSRFRLVFSVLIRSRRPDHNRQRYLWFPSMKAGEKNGDRRKGLIWLAKRMADAPTCPLWRQTNFPIYANRRVTAVITHSAQAARFDWLVNYNYNVPIGYRRQTAVAIGWKRKLDIGRKFWSLGLARREILIWKLVIFPRLSDCSSLFVRKQIYSMVQHLPNRIVSSWWRQCYKPDRRKWCRLNRKRQTAV